MNKLLLLIFSLLFICHSGFSQSANYATAGTGNMRNYISWFDWAGTNIANGTVKNFTTADGLSITVTFSSVSGPAITPFVMNTWSGAVLWKLYDFTNTSIRPALFSQNTFSTAGFTMTVAVTRNGLPTPFTFIAADAEASDNTETTTLSTSGTPWKTIEFFRNSAQTNNPVSGCGTNTVLVSNTYGGAAQTGQNPILATDATGTLNVTTTMARTMGGGMAVAFGIFAPIDRGDLPASYGYAQHGLLFSGENTCNYNLPFPSLKQDTLLRIGNISGDADGAENNNDNASGIDEDGIPSFSSYNGSGQYYIPLSLLNHTGNTARCTIWFDWNRSGTFDINEFASFVIPSATIIGTGATFNGLPVNLPVGVVNDFAFRIRFSREGNATTFPTGYASDGEVEDYLVPAAVIQPCGIPPVFDFGFDQSICSPRTVNFTTNASGMLSYQWAFGDGQTNSTSLTPSVNYAAYGSYPVSLTIEYIAGCSTTVAKNIPVNNAYDNSIINTTDAAICSGDSIRLTAMQNVLSSCWQSSAGLPNPVPANGFVKPSTTTTYYLNAQNTGTNLVVNADFSAGNTGFTSDYINAQPNVTEGQYRVAGNPPSWNPGLSNCSDHTGAGGNMMMVNGSPTVNARIWSQTVSVTPNTNYAFSTWLQSLHPTNPANLKFSINTNIIGNNILGGPVCNWNRFYTTWNSGNNTTAVITIVNNNTIAAGNDFAIDDIFFGPILIKNDSVTISVKSLPAIQTIENATICVGESVLLNTSGAITYSWSPTTGLSDPTGSAPQASPVSTTTYYVSGTNADGCTGIDTVIIAVNNCPPLIANFTIPDSVCVNTPVNIINNTTGGANYLWSFCVGDIGSTPAGNNLGNPGLFSAPTYIDYAFYNGNYYGFQMNYNPSRLIRLDFGNSLLNTPNAIDMGSLGGSLPNGEGGEGIQLVFNEGRWYAIIVGGWAPTGKPERMVKVDFGTALTNLSPVVTNWGNIGNMSRPHDLHIFKEGTNWYGFTTNAGNNTITRFSFSGSFNNPPVGVNLGNLGNLAYPFGIHAINDNGFWRVFVTNAVDASRTNPNPSITRLDFGSSLLNIPVPVNLGNIGNALAFPTDITILQSCGKTIAFGVNANPNVNGIFKLDFVNGLGQLPIASQLGNIGSLDYPHSISRLFRSENDIYGFIPNAAGNTLTRFRFPGCSNATIPNSTSFNPPPVSYSIPGVYNINLTVNEGLYNQKNICKQITVLPEVTHNTIRQLNFCEGDSIKIGRHIDGAVYSWNNGVFTDSITIHIPGLYWIDINRFGCVNRDSFIVTRNLRPVIQIADDTTICDADSAILNTNVSGTNTYQWAPVTGLSNPNIASPLASPAVTTQYVVIVTSPQNCTAEASVQVIVNNRPQVDLGRDTAFCKGDSLVLNAGYAASTYIWQDGTNNPGYIVKDTGIYHVTLTLNGCTRSDTISIGYYPDPVINVMEDTTVCNNTPFAITAQSNGSHSYVWSPASGLSDPNLLSPVATPDTAIKYMLTATNSFNCKARDSVRITPKPSPVVDLGRDTIICPAQTILLDAQNPGAVYAWSNGSNAQSIPVNSAGLYSVTVSKDGCSDIDSVLVSIRQRNFSLTPLAAAVCKDDTIRFTATGGNVYSWYKNTTALNLFDSSILVTATSPAVYSVQITENQCGLTDVLFLPLVIKPAPAVSITKSNDISCAKPGAQLIARGGISYKWTSSASISNDAVADPWVKPESDSWYKVTVTGITGCTTTDSILVKANAAFNGNFYVPNAFTPNNDGKNDCLSVKFFGEATKVGFSVYTRWGDLMFKATSLNQCWDGKYKGKDAPGGVYVYYLEASSNCGTTTQKGIIALIR